jgi:benzoyl-CoA reductase subunit BamC
MCVQWCRTDALTYEEREEKAEGEEAKPDEMDVALTALVERYGLEKIADGIARIAAKG